MTENESLARAIYDLVGPAARIKKAYHCMTRLRLERTEETTDELRTKLAALPGVLGTNLSGNELQIILGPGKVADVTDAFQKILDAEKAAAKETAAPPPSETRPEIGDGKALHAKIRQKNATPVKLFTKRIAGIFVPLIPAFIACGLITGLLSALGKWDATLIHTPLYQLFTVFGDTIFLVLNPLVGHNTAKEFGGTPALGALLGALLAAPGLSGITLGGFAFTPGRGGIISVLLVAAFAALLEKQIKRLVPEALSLFLVPLLTFLVSGLLALFLLQPLGGALADGIGTAATGAIGAGGALTGALLGGTFLPLVMLGLHQALTPIHAQLIASYGVTILLPVLAMAGAGQVGASLAVLYRTKNPRLKKIILSALPVGFLGVGEPLIYGVTLPLGKPFLAACFGGAAGGAIEAAFSVGASALGISGLPLAAATDHIAIYLLGLCSAYLVGFLATLIIGFEDPRE